MLLAVNLVIEVKSGFLPHLINEIYKRNCSTRKVSLLENRTGADIFLIEIIYSNKEKYNGLISKISKYEDNFKIFSFENELEQELSGGLLKVSGRMKVENIIDYEMNVLGAAELTLDMLENPETVNQYSGIRRNVALFCGVSDSSSMANNLKLYTYAERDSVIINTFSGLNAYPLLVNLDQPDDLIRIIRSLKPNFSAARVSFLEQMDDIMLYEHIYDDIPISILGKHYDEIPLYLLIIISYLTAKNKLDVKNCTVGIIGMNISSLRTVRLLCRSGYSRILGSDNDVQLMHGFEKSGGLATVSDNIFNNSDIVIVFKNQLEPEDLKKLGPSQMLISLIDEDIDPDIVKDRGVKFFMQSGWMDRSAFFPGLLSGLINSGIKYLDDDRLIKLAQRISAAKSNDEILPEVFSDVHKKLPEFFRDL
jgi:malate dehydrogenase (oxaloacetate-decarboxylating)